jgi:hypothetical protein
MYIKLSDMKTVAILYNIGMQHSSYINHKNIKLQHGILIAVIDMKIVYHVSKKGSFGS